jgi:hypothetical protein
MEVGDLESRQARCSQRHGGKQLVQKGKLKGGLAPNLALNLALPPPTVSMMRLPDKWALLLLKRALE